MPTITEFATGMPIPRRGFTSLEATEFLKKEFPDVPQWTAWEVDDTKYCRSLSKLPGNQTKGNIGQWQWERVNISYPVPLYWDGSLSDRSIPTYWSGCLTITTPQGSQFLLFSCIDSLGCTGRCYYASTDDLPLLDLFGKDLLEHFSERNKITIHTSSAGTRLDIPAIADDRLILDPVLEKDITQQVNCYFANKKLYEELGLPYRRGFLFVGPPGTGKTMMVRRIIRDSYQIDKGISFWMLDADKATDNSDIGRLFKRAQEAAPSVVVLEDLLESTEFSA